MTANRRPSTVNRQPSCHDSALAEAVGIYRSFILLYLLVAKGTQKPLRCISAGCGELVSKTNAPQRAAHKGLLCFLTPPTPHTFLRLQCGRRFFENTKDIIENKYLYLLLDCGIRNSFRWHLGYCVHSKTTKLLLYEQAIGTLNAHAVIGVGVLMFVWVLGRTFCE